jgi:hypothetical protein
MRAAFGGAQDLQGDTAEGHSAGELLVVHALRQHVALVLDTPQRYPRAGSQSYPSPAAEADADGTTTVYFGPIQPANVKLGNWIQTMPGKGFIQCLRLYSR